MELETVPMDGKGVILEGKILNTRRDIKKHFGEATLKALDDFHAKCREMCSPDEYYEGYSGDDNKHPWGEKTFREVLDEIPDEMARKYVEVAARSDVATESQLTNALNGLKNVLMDDPKYLRLYSIAGGNEKLIEGLAERNLGKVMLQSRVSKITRNEGGSYPHGPPQGSRRDARVRPRRGRGAELLGQPDRVRGPRRRMAIQKHQARYDNAAHYLRVTVQFKKPFWGEHFQGHYVMTRLRRRLHL